MKISPFYFPAILLCAVVGFFVKFVFIKLVNKINPNEVRPEKPTVLKFIFKTLLPYILYTLALQIIFETAGTMSFSGVMEAASMSWLLIIFPFWIKFLSEEGQALSWGRFIRTCLGELFCLIAIGTSLFYIFP